MNNLVKRSFDLIRSPRMAIKRLIDTTLIVVTLPITLPAGFITALIVRINMGSPIFFRQERIGLGEKKFSLLKFRSMLPEHTSTGELLEPSERVTKFGALLRKSSLDELPQLLNVLKGDMSLVGPRPLLVEYLPYYYEKERLRHTVRPGITGAAQVSGRNNLGWDERLSIDADYAMQGKISDDFRILYRTLLGVIRKSDTIAEPWTAGEYLSVYRSYPRTSKLALRRFEPQDIKQRVQWLNDPKTRETLTLDGEVTEESTLRWLKSARTNQLREDFVVYDRGTLDIVAIAGYKSSSADELPIFYFVVDPALQGKGIGTTTLQLLIEHMKGLANLRGAVGEIWESNYPSIKIHERLGFKKTNADLPEGRIRMELKW